MQFNFSQHSHRRFNPLTGSFVLVSPHRAKRPWLGQEEQVSVEERPEYDEKCYLCPGNKRTSGKENPKYETTFLFPNDFPAVQSDQPVLIQSEEENQSDLIRAESVRGTCQVLCFSPKHNQSVSEMNTKEIMNIVIAWRDAYVQLGSLPYVNYVQIFENKGAAMGCSNPHPHGQIWCLEKIPEESTKEIHQMTMYRAKHGRGLLEDYVELELKKRERIVCENDSFLCLVPYWAVWPFETMLVSKRNVADLTNFTRKELENLADMIQRLTCRYDNLFNCSFPYSMGIHQSPTNASEHVESHFHIHFYPPLLRSPTVKKFLVGYEMLGEPQRDLTAEQAAEKLRASPEIHYKNH